jgi:hypothetical protein
MGGPFKEVYDDVVVSSLSDSSKDEQVSALTARLAESEAEVARLRRESAAEVARLREASATQFEIYWRAGYGEAIRRCSLVVDISAAVRSGKLDEQTAWDSTAMSHTARAAEGE